MQQKWMVFHRTFSRTLWYRILRIAIMAALAGLGCLILLNLNLFYVERIDISSFDKGGLNYIDSGQVEEELIEYIDQRLFLISTSEISRKIEEEFFFVKTVYVTKHIPGTLKVRVVEREPALVLRREVISGKTVSESMDAADKDLVIDEEGAVVATCKGRDTLCSRLPISIVSEVRGPLVPGSAIYFPELDGIVEMKHTLDDMDMEIDGFAVPQRSTVVVLFTDTTRAVFSLEAGIEEQLSLFQITRENLLLEGKTYKELDFRYEDPVLRVDKYTEWMLE